MKIGVSGASGQLGKSALQELVARGEGHRIVGVSRTPTNVSAPAEGRHGDYDRPETLARAYEGLDRLLIIPSTDLRPGVRIRQFVAAIDAAAEAGVAHIVLVSVAGTKEAVAPSMGADYWTAEQHLIRTARRWTILRSNFFAEASAQEIQMSVAAGALAGLGEESVGYVSREDVAAAAASVLLGEGHGGAFYDPTGLERITGPKKAAIVSELVGRPVGFVIVDEGQIRAGLAQAKLPAEIVGAIVETKVNAATHVYDVASGHVAQLIGRAPRSFRDVLRAFLD